MFHQLTSKWFLNFSSLIDPSLVETQAKLVALMSVLAEALFNAEHS